VAAGKPEIPESEALRDWNPALHPRDPETGKFVERPFDVPSGVDVSSFADMDTSDLLREIDSGGGDVEGLLQRDDISIDGIPDEANSLGDVDAGEQSFDSVSDPEEARELATNRLESKLDGVNVSLENMDSDQASTLTNTVEQLSDQNPQHFDSVEEIRDHDINATASAAYDPGQNALLFGSASMSGNEAYEGFLAENSGEGTIAHETGHAAHFGEHGDDIFDFYFWPPDVGEGELDQIESEVSEYAAESPEEFVAEVYSVKALGGEVSETVNQIYDDLGGPSFDE
jgi:hypothetical protein